MTDEHSAPVVRLSRAAAVGWPALAALVAVSGVLWSVATPALRAAGGGIRTEAAFVWAVCGGVALLGLAWGSGYRRVAAWGLVAILGQAAALQLIAAGPVVGYQHFRPIRELGKGLGWLWVGILAVQCTLVVPSIVRLAVRGARRQQRLLPPMRWAVLIFGALLLGATASRDPVAYAAELAVAGVVHALAIGTVVLAAASLPESACDDGGWRWSSWLQRGSRWLPWVGAAWVTGAAAVLALVVYEAHPHVPDEVAYLYQARYFAAGMLTMPAPPVPEAFDVNLMTILDGRWNGLFPPGWPALLALGVLIGAPWLVNPLLAGVGVLLAHGVVRRLYGASTARLALLLLCVSPWYVFLGMSLMSHMTALVALLVGGFAVLALRDRGGIQWAVVAGAAAGAVSLVRPLDGIVAAAVLGVGLLAASGAKRWLPRAAAFGAAVVLVGGLQLGYNAAVTGDPLSFPLDENLDRTFGAGTNALGFGPNRGWGWDGLDPLPGHGPADVVVNANLNLTALDVELFGWATGSLVMVLVFLLAGRLRAPDRWMLGVLAAVFLAHALYWFSGGPDFGARYWFFMIVPLVVLSVRGIESAAGRLNAARVATAVAVLGIAAVVAFFPWRSVDKYHHYRGMEPGIRELVRSEVLGRGLVLVQGRRHPDFASAAIYNPLDLTADAPVFAWDRSPDVRRALLAAFPDRSVWIVEGPTVSGGGYRFVAGPLAAQDVREERRR